MKFDEVSADEIREQIESNQRAIELAEKAVKEIEETLRETRRRLAPIRAELRRAGYDAGPATR
jgi:F0F1-type ATP synthase membrane subunit b/b'